MENSRWEISGNLKAGLINCATVVCSAPMSEKSKCVFVFTQIETEAATYFVYLLYFFRIRPINLFDQ